MYSDADVHRAIQIVGNDFIWFTKFGRQTSNLSLVEDTSTFSASLTSFRPDRVVRVWIPSENELAVVPHETILAFQESAEREGTPEKICFTDTTSGTIAGEVYPTPDANYTAKVMWIPLFTSWTAGTSSPDSTLNLPDDVALQVFSTGAVAKLQMNEPEHGYAQLLWKEYLIYRQSMRGAGSTGAKSFTRPEVE